MEHFIGRKTELVLLKQYIESKVSELVVVYGRRRVGKTRLIRQACGNQFSFYITGIANASVSQQLHNFYSELQKHDPKNKNLRMGKNWAIAFRDLISYLERCKDKKKLVFIDELPWLDSHKSDFMSAFEHFWNHWATRRNDVKLIVCGSATSWLMSRLIRNRGGLHNRVTQQIKLSPFNLVETNEFIKAKRLNFTHYQIIEIYMALGGIPHYLDALQRGKSAAQNIDMICFAPNGRLRHEFENLYTSLFRNSANHIAIVRALSLKAKGMTRDELLKASKLPGGGGLSKVLTELEESDFIIKYMPIKNKCKASIYQLTDFYTLFYFNFMEKQKFDKSYSWLNVIGTPRHRAWAGYSFEQVCMMHVIQIKKALGIAGVTTNVASWRSNSKNNKSQIDLLIDRKDQVINLCEIKFCENTFRLTKSYATTLRNRAAQFRHESKTRKALYHTMITTYGIYNNAYAQEMINSSLTLDCLFD